MSHWLFKKSTVAVWLAGAWLALVQFPVYGEGIKLDKVDPGELARHIEIELNAIYTKHNHLQKDQEYDLETLKEDILWALSDDEDDNDPDDEGYVTEAELAVEMEEAHTTLEQVVVDALNQADRIASGLRSPTWAFAGDTRLGYLRLSDFLRVAVDSIAQRPGDRKLFPPKGTQQTTSNLVRVIDTNSR